MSTALIQDSKTKLIVASVYFNLMNSRKEKRSQRSDLQLLQQLIDEFGQEKLLILTDSNARHNSWHDCMCNGRGRELERFIAANNLAVHNKKEFGPTFIKRIKDEKVRRSWIDLTISNNQLANAIENWRMRRNAIATQHQLIEF